MEFLNLFPDFSGRKILAVEIHGKRKFIPEKFVFVIQIFMEHGTRICLPERVTTRSNEY